MTNMYKRSTGQIVMGEVLLVEEHLFFVLLFLKILAVLDKN